MGAHPLACEIILALKEEPYKEALDHLRKMEWDKAIQALKRIDEKLNPILEPGFYHVRDDVPEDLIMWFNGEVFKFSRTGELSWKPEEMSFIGQKHEIPDVEDSDIRIGGTCDD